MLLFVFFTFKISFIKKKKNCPDSLNYYTTAANLVFTVTLSIYHLVINPTNIGVFRLKLPAGAQSGCTTQKIFLLIPRTNILHQICFLRAALKGTIN